MEDAAGFLFDDLDVALQGGSSEKRVAMLRQGLKRLVPGCFPAHLPNFKRDTPSSGYCGTGAARFVR
ncbi:MAG: hypothetical protein ACXWKP_16480 [Bradyrhizobium sp.]